MTNFYCRFKVEGRISKIENNSINILNMDENSKNFLNKKIAFFYREVNPEKIVDYLQQFGSPLRVISLAEAMRSFKKEKVSFVKDEKIFNLWQENFALIHQHTVKDLVLFKERAGELDLFSVTFLVELEQEIHRVGYLMLSRLAKCQEALSHAWLQSSPSLTFLPNLELFFRNGELLRFQGSLRSLQDLIVSPYRLKVREWKCIISQENLNVNQNNDQNSQNNISEAERLKMCYTQYSADLEQTINSLKPALDFILSFYDRKWSLFLSPSACC